MLKKWVKTFRCFIWKPKITLFYLLSFVAIRCTSRYHLLSFVITHCTTRPHLCATRLSFYKRSLWVKELKYLLKQFPLRKTDVLQKLRFTNFKKFVSRSVFDKLQFTQISLNVKTSGCNLKNQTSGKKPLRLFSICFALEIFHLNRTMKASGFKPLRPKLLENYSGDTKFS